MSDAATNISYAMRNQDAVDSLLYFNAPSALKDWSFLAIEGIVFAGFALALVHAIRHARLSGKPSALYTLLGCFLYGLLIDITSYYTVNSFWHGEFSVMFLHNRLPLYIALFYPAFMYHAYMTIHRFGFSPVLQAFSTGFFAGVAYLIFDNLGPLLNWWIWDRADPTNQPFLDSVPFTSYQWFFFFTTAFAYIARTFFWDWVDAGKSPLQIKLGIALAPVATCLVGTAMFIPHNIFVMALGWTVVDGFLYALVFSAAGLAFLLNMQRPDQPRDKLLMVFPLLWTVGQLYIYIAKFHLMFAVSPEGLSAEGLAVGNLPAVIVAIITTVAITLYAHPAPHRSPAGR